MHSYKEPEIFVLKEEFYLLDELGLRFILASSTLHSLSTAKQKRKGKQRIDQFLIHELLEGPKGIFVTVQIIFHPLVNDLTIPVRVLIWIAITVQSYSNQKTEGPRERNYEITRQIHFWSSARNYGIL